MIYATPLDISLRYGQPWRLPADEHLWRSLSERFLRQCGLRPGMRVLNIGCGPGDVALLAAALVGAGGHVLGIDRDARAVASARRRAVLAKLSHVSARVADCETFEAPAPFDAVVGRFALGQFVDPAATMRRLSRFVRPGGVMAFQEIRLDPVEPVALSVVTAQRQRPGEGARWADQAVETGAQLFTLFLRAGLPAPRMLLGAWADVDLVLEEGQAEMPALVGAWAQV